MNDLRFALRGLIKTPGFSLIAILTLALAIGANTAIFSLVNDVLLRPLVPSGSRPVVNLFHGEADANRAYRSFSWQELETLRETNEVFEDVAAINFTLAGIGVGNGSDVRRSMAFTVTSNLMTLLDAQPVRGRFFSAAETTPGADEPVVVLSHSLWQRMGGTDDVIGSTIVVNGLRLTVVGVTPKGFSMGHAFIAPEIWLPLGLADQIAQVFSEESATTSIADPRHYTFNLIGRLRTGLDVESATPRLAALNERLNAIDAAPGTAPRALEIQVPSRFSISTSPSDDAGVSLFGALLLGMSSVVLLIASLNLANMLLARGANRSREIAVRFALGASRARIIRQLLVEGFVLSLIGGALGLVLSMWGNDLLFRSIASGFDSMNFSLIVDPTPNASVMLATLVFCAVATLLSGIGPALKASSGNLVTDLKAQVGGDTATGTWNRFFSGRNNLVMMQLALSLALIFSGGLFFRGALNVGGVDIGFAKETGVIAELDYALLHDSTIENARDRLLTIERQADAQPGWIAALSTQAPFSNTTFTQRFMAAGTPLPASDDKTTTAPGREVLNNAITTDYFAAIGVPLLRGREFTTLEVSTTDAPPVAIIDQRLAATLFPDGDALGQRISRTQAPADGSPLVEFEVVGICAGFRHENFADNPPFRVFVPFARDPAQNSFLHVRDQRSGRDAAIALLPAVRRVITETDAQAPTLLLMPLLDYVEKNVSIWIVRVGAMLFGAFGLVALLLAVIGTYGVKAYAVSRRTREIGIRMALGARPRDVFALIMRQGTLQLLVSLSIGILLALACGKLLSQMLFKVSPFDPLVLGVAATILAIATLIACFLPARRASRVDPMHAIRSE